MAALELKGYEDEDGPDEDEEGEEAIYLDHGDKVEAIDAGNKVGQKRLNWIWLIECGLLKAEQIVKHTTEAIRFRFRLQWAH